LPWSPSTGTGGRHQPETVVPSNWKPWSPWTGAQLDRKIVLARQDVFMTLLGVGPITALALKATIDDPAVLRGREA
jgi:hypothetical protein